MKGSLFGVPLIVVVLVVVLYVATSSDVPPQTAADGSRAGAIGGFAAVRRDDSIAIPTKRRL